MYDLEILQYFDFVATGALCLFHKYILFWDSLAWLTFGFKFNHGNFEILETWYLACWLPIRKTIYYMHFRVDMTYFSIWGISEFALQFGHTI